MKVLIDARLISGRSGGVEQAIIGLADAFSSFSDSEIQFTWLLYEKETNWLAQHFPKNSDVVEMTRPHESNAIRSSLIGVLRGSRLAQRPLATIRKFGPWTYRLPPEPDIVSKIKPSLIHFPTQFGFQTTYPNVYQPHDLQHLHFPEFFPKEVLLIRKIGYGGMIKQATRIIIGNNWTKRDVELRYPNALGKVDNVPVFPQLLPLISTGATDNNNLGDRGYLFYPAAGWVHKNHRRLLAALSQVLKAGREINLVLSGSNLEANPWLLEEIRKLGLQEHVHIVGFVSPSELVNIYKGARAVIVPSLFESASFPIWEAFNLGIPVAAARTTALPDQAGDAAVFFDPLSVEAISVAIMEVLDDGLEISERVEKGIKRVNQFTARNTANGYRFSYRRALELPLDDMDLDWADHGVRF